MYKIYCDENILYHPLLEDYPILSGELKQEVNKAGTLEIVVPAINLHQELTITRKSIIKVFDDDELIFRGVPIGPTRNLMADNTLIVAGELSFLSNSIQLPLAEYFGPVSNLFTQVIEYHNSQVEDYKKFKVGNVTVVNDTASGDIVRSSDHAMGTWEFIEDKFLKPLGGYLNIRHEEDGNYIDYLSDLNYEGNQTVEQCINLIDAEVEIETDSLATVVVPYGAKIKDEEGNETDERITVQTVNNGSIFVENPTAIQSFGRIVKVVTHDNITEPQNLLTAANKDLSELTATKSLILKASDLGKAGESVNSFRIGHKVRVNIKNLGIDTRLLVKKLNIDLLDPSASELQLGQTLKGFDSSFKDVVNNIVTNESNAQRKHTTDEIRQIKIENASNIEQSENHILSEVSKNYYTQGETDELISSLSTSFEQSANGFEMRFNQLKAELDEANGVIVEQNKYIRFVDGEIIIGIEGCPLTAVHTNTSLEFRYNGAVIGKFTNEGLYTRNVNVDNRINCFGKWAIGPGVGGNLDIKWIGGN